MEEPTPPPERTPFPFTAAVLLAAMGAVVVCAAWLTITSPARAPDRRASALPAPPPPDTLAGDLPQPEPGGRPGGLASAEREPGEPGEPELASPSGDEPTDSVAPEEEADPEGAREEAGAPPWTRQGGDSRGEASVSGPEEAGEPSGEPVRPEQTAAVAARQAAESGDYARAGRLWRSALDGAGAGAYTIRISMNCEPRNIAPLLRSLGSEAFLLPYEHQGRPCYRVCYGRYGDRSEALRALQALRYRLAAQAGLAQPIPLTDLL